jgi:hypothetical protein
MCLAERESLRGQSVVYPVGHPYGVCAAALRHVLLLGRERTDYSRLQKLCKAQATEIGERIPIQANSQSKPIPTAPRESVTRASACC